MPNFGPWGLGLNGVNGLLIARKRQKLEKNGKKRLTNRKNGKKREERPFKKDFKRKKTGKKRAVFKRERVSFRSRSSKFWPRNMSALYSTSNSRISVTTGGARVGPIWTTSSHSLSRSSMILGRPAIRATVVQSSLKGGSLSLPIPSCASNPWRTSSASPSSLLDVSALSLFRFFSSCNGVVKGNTSS